MYHPCIQLVYTGFLAAAQLNVSCRAHLAGPAALVRAEQVEIHHPAKLRKEVQQAFWCDDWAATCGVGGVG
jgi:hypothetical protein